MVGFILMKVSSCRISVSPPKITTTTVVTSGISGTRRSSRIEKNRETSIAGMKAAVAAIRSQTK